MISIRRFLVLQALLIWQGGFLFYAAVVVPIGTEILGGSAAQGMITAQVTEMMNVIGLVALVILAVDLRLTTDWNNRRLQIRWWTWGLALLCQLLLFYFHTILDFFMDPARSRIVIGPPFRPVHRMYLWTITVQWVSCLVLQWSTLQAWRGEDLQASKTLQ